MGARREQGTGQRCREEATCGRKVPLNEARDRRCVAGLYQQRDRGECCIDSAVAMGVELRVRARRPVNYGGVTWRVHCAKMRAPHRGRSGRRGIGVMASGRRWALREASEEAARMARCPSDIRGQDRHRAHHIFLQHRSEIRLRHDLPGASETDLEDRSNYASPTSPPPPRLPQLSHRRCRFLRTIEILQSSTPQVRKEE